MKILMLITGMQSGGAERVMATLCNELSLRNTVRLGIMKSDESDYRLSDRVEVVTGNVKGKSFFQSIRFSKKEIEEWKPDIVLSFMTKTNIIALSAKKLAKWRVPVVIAERANPYHTQGVLKIIREHLYRYADGAVFQTEQAREYYKNIIKCESVVLRNPLNPDFNITPYRGKRKKKIVTVGRLSEEKNQALLIRAFSKIANKYPDYRVEIYGAGPLQTSLNRIIQDLDLEKQVFLMGRKENIQRYIQDATIFVLPSNSEGMPNALLEAMALGIPCIATDCPIGGAAFIIRDGKNGILVPMNDVESLESKLSYLIDNVEIAGLIGKEAEKVSEDFSAPLVCSEWEKYLERISRKR